MSISWIVLNKISDRLAIESTAGVALRPRDWRDLGSPPGEHHQLDCVENSISDRLEPAGRAS